MRNARVFISCGQRTHREKNIGMEVKSYFESRGFETYFAEVVRSPEALTEHIFKYLDSSEFFIFIDFKREELPGNKYRGSLFVNQEIAISTFLKIQGLGFYEKGIKREGILDYQIYNAFPFEDGTEIINILKKETKDWDTGSANELALNYNIQSDTRNVITNNDQNLLTDWWHIEVTNRNNNKHAFSCYGYVTEIKNIDTGEDYELPSIELIWSGLGVYSVNIMASGKRELDGFFVSQSDNLIRFQTRPLTTSNPRYYLPKLTNGNYMIEYSIVSSNFKIASRKFLIKHPSAHSDIEFLPQ